MSKVLENEFLEIEGIKEKLKVVADKHGFTVEDLLNVIQKESNFNTSAENKKSKAIGLIQFMPKTAEGLGTSIEEISTMDALGQLDLVDKFFTQNHTKGQHPYITIAYPKAGKMGMDDVIANKGDSISSQNPVWQNDDGSITKRSILKYAGYTEDSKEKTLESENMAIFPSKKGQNNQEKDRYEKFQNLLVLDQQEKELENTYQNAENNLTEEEVQTLSTGNESSKKLHDDLVGKGTYSKSYNDFILQFSNEGSREKLYNDLKTKGSYSKPIKLCGCDSDRRAKHHGVTIGRYFFGLRVANNKKSLQTRG